jgi:hypothetical protein
LSENSIYQLFAGQVTLDKPFELESRVGGGSQTFQTKVRDRVIHSLTP